MKTTAKRVLYVEGNVDGTIGGSYFSLLYLVTGLDRVRFQPVVVFANPNALISRFHEVGAETLIYRHPLPLRGEGLAGGIVARAANFLRGFIVVPIRLARLLRRERIALVHLNNSIRRNHVWIVAALLARVPCITHERGINEEFQFRDRLFARGLRTVICISRAVEQNLVARGFHKLSLVTIHNGLDPAEVRVTRSPEAVRAEFGLAPASRLIGIVGNIRPWKGQEVVIRAMRQLRDEMPDVTCLMIGEAAAENREYREHLLRLVNDLGLGGRIVITGYRSDVGNYVNILEVLIHASVSPEPFGRVLLEGMALEKALVASRGGAVPEIVIDDVTGLLFTPGDADELASRLRVVLGDSQRARSLGKEGRKRLVEEFSIDNNVRQTMQLYEALLGQ